MGYLHGVACRLTPLELAIGTACVVTLNSRVRASDERPDRVGKTQQRLRLDSVDGCHPIEVAIERHDVDDHPETDGFCQAVQLLERWAALPGLVARDRLLSDARELSKEILRQSNPLTKSTDRSHE